VDVEGGLAAVGVLVDQAELGGVPGVPVGRAHEAALARAGDGLEAAAEREVDELDVVDGDVGAGVAALDPLGELPLGDALGLQEGAVAVVDVLELAVVDERAELLVVGVAELVVDDLRQDVRAATRRALPRGPGGLHVRS
jgi:hypothetical protein